MRNEYIAQTDITTRFFGILGHQLQHSFLRQRSHHYDNLKHQSGAPFDMVCNELLLIPHERALDILQALPDSLKQFTCQLQESNPYSQQETIDEIANGIRLATEGTIVITTFYAALQKVMQARNNPLNNRGDDFSDELYATVREVTFPEDSHLLEAVTEDGTVIVHPLEEALHHYIGLVTENIVKRTLHTHPLSDEGIRLAYEYRLSAYSAIASLLS